MTGAIRWWSLLCLCLSAPFPVFGQEEGDGYYQVDSAALVAFPDTLLARDGYPRIVRDVMFDQRDVFDPESDDWFFGAKVMNALHVVTQPYILEDEL